MKLTIYTEKRNDFNQESIDIKQQLKNLLNIDCNVRLLNGYTVENIEEKDITNAIRHVFSEPMIDIVYESIPKTTGLILAREPLPGQYDQRSDSAIQCIKCLDFESEPMVKSFQVIIFDRNLDEVEQAKFIKYWINPVEMRLKDLNKESLVVDEIIEPKLLDFCNWDESILKQFLVNQSAAMTLDDLKLIQSYFNEKLNRDLSYTEFKVLDTYWSDHCRHTTFETEISDITIEEGPYKEAIEQAFNQFLKMRNALDRTQKPITLMEMATIVGRYNKDPRIELSDEVNACSVMIDVDVDNRIEEWLLMFKNETHNHPTEIEPFGGASTCIGGAIRDPLSGRSYVYQAMRISGCGNVKESFESTLANKLPQRIIASKATHGNSSYGNQIGVTTSFVKEIYHPSYAAKHLECGAVVGAVKKEYVKRLKPEVGDIVILLGGRTGRDGIGGATGSSKIQSSNSLQTSGSEVQKGNAPEERKLQRLFRNPNVTQLIKKANDFGAGGVCVAIGELADGCTIQLDKVPLKYAGLTPTEIAISESQERMAVVIDPKDCGTFLTYARNENVEATIVATITDTNRLVMKYGNEDVVDLPRELINTNGVRQKISATLSQKSYSNSEHKPFSELSLLEHLNQLNVSSQKGLIEQFDGSIGSTTVLYPLGGKHQLTPALASVQKISLENGTTNTVSILAYGFNPSLAEINPFISAQASVLESIARTIAVGGTIKNIFFSFQEYFARLYKDPKKWGNVVQTLLGAQSVQEAFGRPAIGGKDSMSGSFNEKDVVETFISFACSTSVVKNIISNETKSVGNKLYFVQAKRLDNGLFDLDSIKQTYLVLEELIASKQVVSAHTISHSLASSLCEMSFGNGLGFNIKTDLYLLSDYPASLIIEVNPEIDLDFDYLGEVTDNNFVFNGITIDYNHAKLAYESGLTFLYPIVGPKQDRSIDTITSNIGYKPYAYEPVEKVNVVIAVFPGTNCEVDTARAFEKAGAHVKQALICNLDANQLKESIHNFCTLIDNAHILALPGGFSGGDEPDGSAKFIVNILLNEDVRDAVNRLLNRDGLMIGICNGFQALIKTGYLPYGEIRQLNESDATLAHNTIHRHISTMANIRQSSDASPWLSTLDLAQVSKVPLSHGEGRLVISPTLYKTCLDNGQIAFQYVNHEGNATMDPHFNVNGSSYAIEGMISPNGRILGKMGHTERIQEGCYINIPNMSEMKLFENGVNFFKRGKI